MVLIKYLNSSNRESIIESLKHYNNSLLKLIGRLSCLSYIDFYIVETEYVLLDAVYVIDNISAIELNINLFVDDNINK